MSPLPFDFCGVVFNEAHAIVTFAFTSSSYIKQSPLRLRIKKGCVPKQH
jgi:hypothetical protein